MYDNDMVHMVSIAYELWTRTCLGENTHAFVIEAENEELLEKVIELYDNLYPDRSRIKHFPIVRKLGRNDFSNPIAYIVRDRSTKYVLTRRDMELELRTITKEDVFTITDARDYIPEKDATIVSRPSGCPWIPQSTF